MLRSNRNLPHLYLRNHGQSERYKRRAGGRNPQPPYRDRLEHAAKLERALSKAILKARQQVESRLSDIAVGERGFYLEFEVEADKANAFEQLGDKRRGIELVSAKTLPESENTIQATVFVPESATDFFLKKLEKYRDEENKKGKPKNEALISRITDVEIGTVQSLFTDDLAFFPAYGQTIWWEVWLRRDQREEFHTIAERFGIKVKPHIINFPERTVLLANADVEGMELIIKNSDTVAELRIAKDTPALFFEMEAREQREWIEDLEKRTLSPKDDAVVVCLLYQEEVS